MPQLSPTHRMHRRKSSKDENDTSPLMTTPHDTAPSFADVTVNEHENTSPTPIGPPPGRRNRLSMGPPSVNQTRRGHTRTFSGAGTSPTSASPLRTSFAIPDTNGVNGHHPPLTSPFRSSFSPPTNHSHSRNRSISAYSPSLPSPLSIPSSSDTSYSSSSLSPSATLPNINTGYRSPPMMTASYSNPDNGPIGAISVPTSPQALNGIPNGLGSNAAQHKRRHSRMHSRNLSVFFPRPGSLPSTVISEDGDQSDTDAPVSAIPSAGSSVHVRGSRRGGDNPPLTPLGQGFKFGAKPPSHSTTEDDDDSSDTPPPTNGPAFSRPARRGHHHKHSMSHNFFSFLEPGSNLNTPAVDLHTQPTPTPQSPWAPMSAIQDAGFSDVQNGQARPPLEVNHDIPVAAAATGVAQFLLGAYLWVSGQQIGSLSTTGLGYWVVFDAFGLGVGRLAPPWLAKPPPAAAGSALAEKEAMRKKIRRPYGNGRMETVLMFAQAVYLMFSAVYVCKETVEHLLLSAGGQEGHHHHAGDEDPSHG